MTAQIKTYKGFQLTRNSLGRWCGVYTDPVTGTSSSTVIAMAPCS